MYVASSLNAVFELLIGTLLCIDTVSGKYTKRSQYFLCLVQLQNDLNIMGMLVICDCVHCDVFKSFKIL